jgi:ATP synthase F1 gamma subunit
MGDIIDTLKATALVQFRLFQMKNKPNDYFLKEIESCIRILVTTMNRHPYFVERKGLSSAIVIVTSDEGFLGELNILLVNAGLEVRDSKDDEIIVLGERGAKYLEEMNENFVSFPGISEEINDKDIDTICSYLLKCYHKKFRRILIVYPEFSSLTVQKVKLLQALPYQPISQQPEFNLNGKDMMIEPSLGSVLECLIKLWLGYKLFEIFWSSKQSEYAARVMHLEGSTQELTYLNQRLALSYFRQVHALSDKTIREISASRILLSSYR